MLALASTSFQAKPRGATLSRLAPKQNLFYILRTSFQLFNMKPSITLLLATPLVFGWKIKFFDKEGYQTVIHERDGTLGQACKNLGSNENKAESMQWDSEGAFTRCKIKLFDSGDCSGDPFGDSGYGKWYLPAFKSSSRNKLSSYDIDCK